MRTKKEQERRPEGPPDAAAPDLDAETATLARELERAALEELEDQDRREDAWRRLAEMKRRLGVKS